jgi:hypothetical protein
MSLHLLRRLKRLSHQLRPSWQKPFQPLPSLHLRRK